MSAILYSSRISRLCLPRNQWLTLSATFFGEVDRKGGYNHKEKKTAKELVTGGLKLLKKDIKKFHKENIDMWDGDHRLYEFCNVHGSYDYFWKFEGVESLDDWVVSTDRDNLEGFSKAKLSLSKSNKALFQGYLSQRIPKDGVVKKAGYANLRSPFNMKSFSRMQSYNWSKYTHLLMKIRGDGRPFNICVHMERYYSNEWFEMYNFTLFTRGGPYWQIAKIPFTKFFLSNRGRISDNQRMADLQNVRSLGFTLGDGYDGPFQLEIDSIALMYDENHKDQVEFEYEVYKQPNYCIG